MIHSRILIVCVVLHVLVILQRLGSPLVWSETLSVLLDIGCAVNILSLSLAATTFVLLSLRPCRLAIPKAGFAAFMGFVALLESCAFGLFLLYSFIEDPEVDENERLNGKACVMLSFFGTISAIAVLPLFLVTAPPDVKSHRPENYDNGI